MYKFAHIADCHLGAQKHPELKKLELTAFKKCLNKCIQEKVDFIIISGDLFHSNIPDMGIVKEAVGKLKQVHEMGIPIYVVYGSHDFSPNETSIIDVIAETGLLKKVVKAEGDKKLKLRFTVDPKTNAKLTGISGRKTGIEKEYFEILDRKQLENEDGFKIFVFHSAIEELKPEFLSEMESIPLSSFPKGFDYYAGGHIHKHSEHEWLEHEKIVYPGPLFAGYPRDFELSAKGEKRGFYIVNFDGKVENMEFVEINVCDYAYIHYDVSGKNSIQVQNELLEKLEKVDVENKLVLLKISGELSGGKTSNIDSKLLRGLLIGKGAIHVNINRHGLTSKNHRKVKLMGEDIPTMESKVFKENIGNIRLSNKNLKSERGIKLANELLRILRQEQKPNEKKGDYEKRIRTNALEFLLEGKFDN